MLLKKLLPPGFRVTKLVWLDAGDFDIQPTNSVTLEVEAACSSENSKYINSTWCRNPKEDHYLIKKNALFS
jgi:hypothetical protein